MTIQEAIKFCTERAKKKDSEAKKFRDIAALLISYDRMKDKYFKYEFVCKMMSADEYLELANTYLSMKAAERKKNNGSI